MSTRKRVSEKTLELNVTAEILQAVRHQPGCEAAFWIGMKQHQEARNGIDELLSNVPHARHLALQFKAPAATRPDATPYTYSLNESQHSRLLLLAAGRPDAVFYTLPDYNTFARLANASPTLLVNTYFMRVRDVGTLTGSTSGRHRVECHEAPPAHAWVYSDPQRIRLVSAKEALDSEADPPLITSDRVPALLSNDELVDWIDGLGSAADGNLHRVGQWLRGFGTLCVP